MPTHYTYIQHSTGRIVCLRSRLTVVLLGHSLLRIYYNIYIIICTGRTIKTWSNIIQIEQKYMIIKVQRDLKFKFFLNV